MHDIDGCRAQRSHFGRRRGRIPEPDSGAGRRLGLVEHAVYQALAADLLDVAERLLLDGGESAGDVAFRRLRIHQVAGLVAVADLLVDVEDELELPPLLAVSSGPGAHVPAPGEARDVAVHQPSVLLV